MQLPNCHASHIFILIERFYESEHSVTEAISGSSVVTPRVMTLGFVIDRF